MFENNIRSHCFHVSLGNICYGQEISAAKPQIALHTKMLVLQQVLNTNIRFLHGNARYIVSGSIKGNHTDLSKTRYVFLFINTTTNMNIVDTELIIVSGFEKRDNLKQKIIFELCIAQNVTL